MNNVVQIDSQETLPAAATPMDMLQIAVEGGADIAVLEKLMALQERWEANQGRKAFDNAISAAKSELPTIIKTKEVDYVNNKGQRTHYQYEDLASIAETVTPILSKHGLSYRYRTSQKSGIVSVTCIISHRDGYSEETTLSAGRDETGSKNNIQAVGSTLTYLQRMTLKAALGLAAAVDDDGSTTENGEPINDDQIKALFALIKGTVE